MTVPGKTLAGLLGVAPATLSQATTHRHRCRGHDVASWAIREPSGRVSGYAVPPEVAGTFARLNPEPAPATLPTSGPTSEAGTPGPPVISLLPPGEDYARPAVALAAGEILKAAIEADNTTGRGVVVLLAGFCGGTLCASMTSKEGRVGGFVAGGMGAAAVAAWALGLLEKRQPPVAASGAAQVDGRVWPQLRAVGAMTRAVPGEAAYTVGGVPARGPWV